MLNIRVRPCGVKKRSVNTAESWVSFPPFNLWIISYHHLLFFSKWEWHSMCCCWWQNICTGNVTLPSTSINVFRLAAPKHFSWAFWVSVDLKLNWVFFLRKYFGFFPFKIDAIQENVSGDGLIELFMPTRLVRFPFSKLVFSSFVGKMYLNSHWLSFDNSVLTSTRDWPIWPVRSTSNGSKNS